MPLTQNSSDKQLTSLHAEKNLLDVAFHRNCLVHAQRDEFFDKQYDCSDHQSINLNVEKEHQEAKPVIDK